MQSAACLRRSPTLLLILVVELRRARQFAGFAVAQTLLLGQTCLGLFVPRNEAGVLQAQCGDIKVHVLDRLIDSGVTIGRTNPAFALEVDDTAFEGDEALVASIGAVAVLGICFAAQHVQFWHRFGAELDAVRVLVGRGDNLVKRRIHPLLAVIHRRCDGCREGGAAEDTGNDCLCSQNALSVVRRLEPERAHAAAVIDARSVLDGRDAVQLLFGCAASCHEFSVEATTGNYLSAELDIEAQRAMLGLFPYDNITGL